MSKQDLEVDSPIKFRDNGFLEQTARAHYDKSAYEAVRKLAKEYKERNVQFNEEEAHDILGARDIFLRSLVVGGIPVIVPYMRGKDGLEVMTIGRVDSGWPFSDSARESINSFMPDRWTHEKTSTSGYARNYSFQVEQTKEVRNLNLVFGVGINCVDWEPASIYRITMKYKLVRFTKDKYGKPDSSFEDKALLEFRIRENYLGEIIKDDGLGSAVFSRRKVAEESYRRGEELNKQLIDLTRQPEMWRSIDSCVLPNEYHSQGMRTEIDAAKLQKIQGERIDLWKLHAMAIFPNYGLTGEELDWPQTFANLANLFGQETPDIEEFRDFKQIAFK